MEVERYREAAGCTKEEARKVVDAVGGRLADAFFLYFCLKGCPPPRLSSQPSLDIRSGFTVNVQASDSTRSSHGTDPAKLTNWQVVPLSTLNRITAEERRKGHLRSDESERCAICMCDFESQDEGEIVHLGRCKEHFFHRLCIEAAVTGEAVKCPVCGETYGEMEGTMPSGRMRVELAPTLQCQSYPPGAWVIHYEFRNGVQDGLNYTGNSRQALLPNTEEGREILRLFICAFYRRHTFRIGNSVTNGTTDTVVWAGIHHKSNPDGGPTNFGYPDPTYFSRVREELAARGVFYSA